MLKLIKCVSDLSRWKYKWLSELKPYEHWHKRFDSPESLCIISWVPLNWNANTYQSLFKTMFVRWALWNRVSENWSINRKRFSSFSFYLYLSLCLFFIFLQLSYSCSLFYLFLTLRGVRKGIVMVLKLDKISVSAIDLVGYSVDI